MTCCIVAWSDSSKQPVTFQPLGPYPIQLDMSTNKTINERCLQYLMDCYHYLDNEKRLLKKVLRIHHILSSGECWGSLVPSFPFQRASMPPWSDILTIIKQQIMQHTFWVLAEVFGLQDGVLPTSSLKGPLLKQTLPGRFLQDLVDHVATDKFSTVWSMSSTF